MNVAVAPDSPLAQYLAELENDSSAINAVSAPSLPPNESAQAPPSVLSDYTTTKCTDYRGKTPKSTLFTSAKLYALNKLLTKLSTSDSFANLRENVIEAAGTGDAMSVTICWWIPQTIRQFNGTVVPLIFTTAIAVAVYGVDRNDVPRASVIDSMQSVITVVLVAIVVIITTVEVFYQLLLVWYTYAGLRLIKVVHRYSTALMELQEAFRLVVDVIKRSELAARGYRLGRTLPPIGRLEEASAARDPNFELQCRRLRSRLRSINDMIERTARGVASRSLSSLDASVRQLSPMRNSETNGASDGSATPSLLVTALTKRHALSVLLLENTVREDLEADCTKVMRSLGGRGGDQNFIQTIIDHTATFTTLASMMGIWASDLSRWSPREQLEALVDHDSDDSGRQQIRALPRDVGTVSRALLEFQVSCKTLKTLAHTSQLDIDDVFSGSSFPCSTGEVDKNATVAHWHKRMRRSRDQIGRLMDQLANDWDHLERAIEAVGDSSTSLENSDGTTNPEDEDVDEDECEHGTEVRQQGQEDSERNYLLVYTATSTGEKDFDLQTLIQQQRVRTDAETAPVPSFMSELQAVLERRQALPSVPTLEKRIGDDGTTAVSTHSSLSQQRASSARILMSERPKPVDLQHLIQSRFTAQLTEEYFGSDESEEECEERTPTKPQS